MGWIIVVIIGLFAATVLFGAPFVPTRHRDVETALDLLDLKPGETLIELGSGDGRLLSAAAKRGWSAVGYEINPLLALIATIRTWPVRGRVSVHWDNYKSAKWPRQIKGLYVFGSKREMRFIKKRLDSLSNPVNVVSYGFELPGQEPTRTEGPFYVYRDSSSKQ